MIIAATRLTTATGHQAIAHHVLRGEGNEQIVLLRGSEDDLVDMFATARHAGARYAIRHYHLSPGDVMSDAGALSLVGQIADEFGFDPDATVVVRHEKPRAAAASGLSSGIPGSGDVGYHWHLLAPEVDPITLRVMDSRNMSPRHEKLARLAELEHGHEVTQGCWNRAVLEHLQRGGPDQHAAAQRLDAAGLDDRIRARAAYSSATRRRLERRHYDYRGAPLHLPTLVFHLHATWQRHCLNGEALRLELWRLGLRVAVDDSGAGQRLLLQALDGRARHLYEVGLLPRLLRMSAPKVMSMLMSCGFGPAQRGVPSKLVADATPNAKPPAGLAASSKSSAALRDNPLRVPSKPDPESALNAPGVNI